MSEDLETFLKRDPNRLRLKHIRTADMCYLGLDLVVMTFSFSTEGPVQYHWFKIACSKAVDYSIKPRDPNCLEGGKLLKLYDRHSMLHNDELQGIPGGDGRVFDPPRKFKLLILEQSYVIAEKFEVEEFLPDQTARPKWAIDEAWHPMSEGLETLFLRDRLSLWGVPRAELALGGLRLFVVAISRSHQRHSLKITCSNAQDYSIRPRDPNCIEGGPFLEFHNRHAMVDNNRLQAIPHADGALFDPPRKFRLLILEQSYVIAEKFEVAKWSPSETGLPK